jgi:hypothetical protein
MLAQAAQYPQFMRRADVRLSLDGARWRDAL